MVVVVKSSKNYYTKIDIIRVFACFAVLLYHLNLLKGGYLAVCTFFVLTSYLSCLSSFKKDNLSLKEYYSKLFSRIYLPLIIVVLLSLFVISLIPGINWINLKPETTSVILGYNNYWQLSANLDYFARHVSSPFMHLWYIGILLQFDLVFPFIFKFFRKLEKRFKKQTPIIGLFIICFSLLAYFIYKAYTENVMIVYYDTLIRSFSLLFGVLLGFIHNFYKEKIKLSNKKYPFYFYLIILTILCVFIDASLPLYPIAMILTTFITCRLIDYAILSKEDKKTSKTTQFFSNISYEIYLVSYPLIFIFEYIYLSSFIEIPIIIILTIGISYIIHLALKNSKWYGKMFKIFILILMLLGLYKYIIAKDYTKEMKGLEDQLNHNQEIMKDKQNAYEQKLKEEENNWNLTLENLELEASQLKDFVYNMPVVGIGDSVMLGALTRLYEVFPNGYFDAAISRTAWVANGIITNLKNNKLLGDAIVLNLGANGDCPDSCKKQIMKSVGNRKLFWVNTTNASTSYVNDNINKLAEEYSNVYVVDWNSAAKGHDEYFIADKIHLTKEGTEAYINTLYNKMYEVYLNEYNAKKDALLSEREEVIKNKISFYGNDMLLNAYDSLEEYFPSANFKISDNYYTLFDELEKSASNKSLNNKVVFILGDNFKVNKSDYDKILKICKGHEVYFITMKDYKFIENNYNLSNDLEAYLMIDKIHLTKDGSEKLAILINDIFNTK